MEKAEKLRPGWRKCPRKNRAYDIYQRDDNSPRIIEEREARKFQVVDLNQGRLEKDHTYTGKVVAVFPTLWEAQVCVETMDTVEPEELE